MTKPCWQNKTKVFQVTWHLNPPLFIALQSDSTCVPSSVFVPPPTSPPTLNFYSKPFGHEAHQVFFAWFILLIVSLPLKFCSNIHPLSNASAPIQLFTKTDVAQHRHSMKAAVVMWMSAVISPEARAGTLFWQSKPVGISQKTFRCQTMTHATSRTRVSVMTQWGLEAIIMFTFHL